MKKRYLSLLSVLILSTVSAVAQTFTLKSETLGGQATNKEFANTFGCTGENISPELHWENAPEGTKSFAITVYDPDAPTGSGFWHWVVTDIPADMNELKEGISGELPKGIVESRTDYGAAGYGGPCPPEGDRPHAYIITVFALKTDKLGLDPNTPPAVVGFNLNANVIEKASIVFYGQR